MTYSLCDKVNGKTNLTASLMPDFVILKDAKSGMDGTCQVEKVMATDIHPAYLRTVVTFSLSGNSMRHLPERYG